MSSPCTFASGIPAPQTVLIKHPTCRPEKMRRNHHILKQDDEFKSIKPRDITLLCDSADHPIASPEPATEPFIKSNPNESRLIPFLCHGKTLIAVPYLAPFSPAGCNCLFCFYAAVCKQRWKRAWEHHCTNRFLFVELCCARPPGWAETGIYELFTFLWLLFIV